MRYLLGVLIALLAIEATPPAWAETPEAWTTAERLIQDAWRTRKEVLALGRDALDRRGLDRIQELKTEYGISSLPEVTYALVSEAQERTEDAPAVMEARLSYAETFSGEQPFYKYFLCKSSVFHCFEAFVSELNEDASTFLWVANAFYVFLFIVAGLTAAGFLYLIVKFRLSLAHRLAHMITGASGNGISLVLLLLGVLSYVWVGWVGPPALLTLLFWRYCDFSERAMLILLFILMAAVPVGLFAPALYYHHSEGIGGIIVAPLKDSHLDDRANILSGWIKDHPKDVEAMFALALIEKQTRRYEQAEQILNQALQVNPNFYKASLNLANVEYLLGKTDAAIARLQSVIATSHQPIVAHFNLSKIFYRQQRIDEALVENKKAKDINPSLFAQLDRRSNPNDPRTFLIDAAITSQEKKGELWKLTDEIRETRNRFHAHAFPALPGLAYWIFLGVTLLLSISIGLIWPVRRTPKSCEKCGMPSCEMCDPQVEHEALCSQCYHIFVRLESVDPQSRKRKEAAITRNRFFRDIREQWSAFLLPGIQLIFSGNLFSGIFTLIMVIVCAVLLLPDRFLIPDPMQTMGFGAFPFYLPAGILLFLIYVLSVVGVIRR